jgi:ADP-ribose pyrophosphatase YjhB (NUDIX family)
MRYLRLVGTISGLVAFPTLVHSFALPTVLQEGQKCSFHKSLAMSSQASSEVEMMDACDDQWSDILPFETGSHNSAKIIIPSEISDSDPFLSDNPTNLFQSTVLACKMNDKSSIWVHVPMKRSSIIEAGQLYELGFRFHHAVEDVAVLNLWLRDSESKVPNFSTHNVGVGAFVVNSQNQILCVRELRKNYMPWKTPTGTSELGESIEDAAIREVFEETGIRTTFHSILGFRQTHGMAHGRSDLYFVCRLDPIEEQDDRGKVVIPTPCAQACEIETAEWVPFDDYKRMVDGEGSQKGHPMMSQVLHAFKMGRMIEKKVVESVVPGRLPNDVYFPR